MFPICLSISCVFYLLDRVFNFIGRHFLATQNIKSSLTFCSWNMDNSRHVTAPNSDHTQGYPNVSTE